MKTSNNLVGSAGEYYVCGEICRQGYLALITPKNNPLFDIVASNPEGTRSIAIQVKTRSIQNDQGWKLGRMWRSRETIQLYLLCWSTWRKKDSPNSSYMNSMYWRSAWRRTISTIWKSRNGTVASAKTLDLGGTMSATLLTTTGIDEIIGRQS